MTCLRRRDARDNIFFLLHLAQPTHLSRAGPHFFPFIGKYGHMVRWVVLIARSKFPKISRKSWVVLGQKTWVVLIQGVLIDVHPCKILKFSTGKIEKKRKKCFQMLHRGFLGQSPQGLWSSLMCLYYSTPMPLRASI